MIKEAAGTWMTRSPTRKTEGGSEARRTNSGLAAPGGLSSFCSRRLRDRVPAWPFFMGDSTCAPAAARCQPHGRWPPPWRPRQLTASIAASLSS